MKKIKIAQLAPLWIPVPPKTYGGLTEGGWLQIGYN